MALGYLPLKELAAYAALFTLFIKIIKKKKKGRNTLHVKTCKSGLKFTAPKFCRSKHRLVVRIRRYNT